MFNTFPLFFLNALTMIEKLFKQGYIKILTATPTLKYSTPVWPTVINKPVLAIECAMAKIAMDIIENVIVSVPTASGKTLIGYISIYDTYLKGKKSMYIVPLRSLAMEKFSWNS